ncbi:MAG TPA: MraY family glycosyltransferase [Thermoanaerobaculia bacterium]|nr:MraY family glycosyltransferase [Thermoanaerobaculia bacterium]
MSENIVPLVFIFVMSGLTSFFSTRFVKRLAERLGAIDRPDDRKFHREDTPRLGGLAIIAGFAFPLTLIPISKHAAQLVSKNLAYLFAVLAAGCLMIALGVYDDLVGSNATKKFSVQGAAALILVAFGFSFRSISVGGWVLDLGVLGVAASIVWIVGVINAFNFIDGIDSLATVVALTIAVAFMIIAVLRHDIFSLVIMTALAGSLAGFYPWNKPPAKIFMGDTGSLFIGLLLAACSIARPAKSPVALIIGGPILALALPVIDTLIVMKQRFGGPTATLGARITRMFNADRRHMHHILVAKYGSDGKAVLSIWALTLVFGVAAVLTAIEELKLYGYFCAIAGLLTMLLLRYGRSPSDAAAGPNGDAAKAPPEQAVSAQGH